MRFQEKEFNRSNNQNSVQSPNRTTETGLIDIEEDIQRPNHKKHKTEGQLLQNMLKTHDAAIAEKDKICGNESSLEFQRRDNTTTEIVVEGMMTRLSDTDNFDEQTVNSNTLQSRRSSNSRFGSFFEEGRFERQLKSLSYH